MIAGFYRKPPRLVIRGQGFAREGLHEAKVAGNGELVIPEDVATRYGIAPDRETLMETPEGLSIQPADSLLTKIYVEPTTACNLNCPICMRRSWQEPGGTMEMETFNRIVAGLHAVPSVKTMAFWGIGEPMLHSKVSEMVATAKKQGLRTELITNGSLLDKRMAKDLLAADLDTLVVSVDGGSQESKLLSREEVPLELIKENVRTLHYLRRRMSKHNPEIGIEFVLTKSNLSQLPEIPLIASAMEASFIVITNVLPYSSEYKDEILYWSAVSNSYPGQRTPGLPEITLPLVDGKRDYMKPILELIQRSRGTGLPPSRPSGVEDYCPFVREGTMTVAWDGGVSPCIPLMHSYTCFVMGREKFIRQYKVGNVNQEDIGCIWNSDEYKGFRARVSSFDFSPCVMCGGCRMAETNERDCFGHRFPVCGDCLWARGVIVCP